MNRRELLPALGTGAAFGILATLVGTAPGCASTPTHVIEADPLLDLVNLYRNTRDGLEARRIEDDDEFDAEMDRIIDPLWRRLKHETPTATTEAGAIAALRLAHEEGQHSVGSFDKSLVAAALSYFEGRV